MIKNKNINKKTILIISVAAVLLTGGAFAAYRYTQDNDQPNSPAAGDGINYDPPTEAEKRETEQYKKDLANKPQDSDKTNPSGSFKSVVPVITSLGKYDGTVEASARVPGVNEEGGKCTLVLTKGTKKVSASRTSVSNVSEVSCGYISIPMSKLSAGVWSATVNYSSPKAQGTSKPSEISI